VIIIIEPTELKIPDGISPNGDGLNDVFFIEGLSGYPDNEILIFNRWGNRVFGARPYANNWDGVSDSNLTIGSGNRLPAGTYFYVLKLSPKNHVTGYLYIAY
jgi:gliding motility-associated-like protein